MQERLRLDAGDLSLELAPSIGGSIVAFAWRDQPILRPTEAAALETGQVRGMASYPLVPYSNRIGYGRFPFGGREHRLVPNFAGEPHALHGVGWRKPWRVVSAGPDHAELALEHSPDGAEAEGWPFAFEARQRFALRPDRLIVRMSLRNTGRSAAPAGMGMHPFFPRRAGSVLGFRARGVWLNGGDRLPLREAPPPADCTFDPPRSLEGAALDNCFTGWDGAAELRQPDGPGVRLTADALFGHLVVFTPPDRDFCAIEPVSHMVDALNRADQPASGLRVLQPDEVLAGDIVLQPLAPS